MDMIRSRMTGFAMLVATLGLAMAGPVAAESSTSHPQSVFDATRPPGGHYHEGELGEKLLIVEHSIRCNCSCGLDVHSCQFQMQCGVSPGWSQRIMQQLQAGETVEAIQAGFVADFGGTVLMSPPAEGFNLVGYLLPSVAIITAGMLIGLIVRAGASGRTRPARVAELGAEDEERLRDALRQLDEAEGPDW
jgi:cytochrome c-type biogenesis protein CcmH/NrfF